MKKPFFNSLICLFFLFNPICLQAMWCSLESRALLFLSTYLFMFLLLSCQILFYFGNTQKYTPCISNMSKIFNHHYDNIIDINHNRKALIDVDSNHVLYTISHTMYYTQYLKPCIIHHISKHV